MAFRLSDPLGSTKSNLLRLTWEKLAPLPGGKALYSAFVGRMAPYTGSIGAKVEELSAGHCEVTMSDRRVVRNHLSSVHAVALVNLAELTGNLALAYSMPDDARFIVAGLSIDYLKKARGTIRGVCDVEPPTTNERREHEVVVSLRNEAGEEVARATLRTLVGPKKGE